MKQTFAWTLALAAMLCGSANAATIVVTSDIATSTTWTADNVYDMQNQIYVLPGATLTIEPGTLIQSTAGLGGSLAVTRGAKIYANGTAGAPIIFTSTLDDLVNWHEGVNEWGNLTLMGNALTSGSHYGGVAQSYQDGATAAVHINTKVPDGLNKKVMEGLLPDFAGDPRVLYGGDDDDDDSGALTYVSIRYGGRITAQPNKELNGLSLGGIGRGTDISHIEIMNNVDDGIEIWGGTVNLKYVNIWNIGDDSLDVDQGWRGKAQFGLIVQGYGADAAQGSGVGDNAFEMDGAEESDAQPVTTSTIYNFTVVGQPIDGDHGTAWRDNARVQLRNCIFMDLGEQLVRFDGDDGDGQAGYGYNGTLSWADTWTTDYSVTSPINAGTWTPGAFNDPAVLYTVQTSGKLAEIKDSVFFNNLHASAYTEATARGVFAAANNNVLATLSPIQQLDRGPLVVKGGKNMLPVTFINPCAANDAVASVAAAPADGFFTPASYRGAFDTSNNWLLGWTAVHAYGMTAAPASVESWERY